jgi:hypothetical protein
VRKKTEIRTGTACTQTNPQYTEIDTPYVPVDLVCSYEVHVLIQRVGQVSEIEGKSQVRTSTIEVYHVGKKRTMKEKSDGMDIYISLRQRGISQY